MHSSHYIKSHIKLYRFTCAMLIALLTLHSSCWLSFLAHIRQSLEYPNGLTTITNSYNLIVSTSNLNSDLWNAYRMLYCFAICNLALVFLVCWCKRRHLVRASQQMGLRRAMSQCRYWLCCCFCCDQSVHSSTPASSLMSASKSSDQTNNLHPFYETTTTTTANNHQQQQTKISPSSQSLFMLSQSQSQLYGTNYVQQPQSTYGIATNNNTNATSDLHQQHLYQPVFGNAIGESSLALNEPMQRQYQHLATLGHQQQRMPNNNQQQQHSFTLSRPIQQQQQQQQQLMMLDANQTLKQQQQQQQAFYLQHANSNANSRTLGYQRALMMKQQQQQPISLNQNQIEPEGPLVALGNSGPASSVGSSGGSSSSNSHSDTNNNQHHFVSQQQQQQLFDQSNQQQMHFRRPSQQQQQQLQMQRQLHQQQMQARQNQRSSSSEMDESGHIYDTAQNCYSSLAIQ